MTVKYFADRKSKISVIFAYAIKALGIILKVSKDYYPLHVFGLTSAGCIFVGSILFGAFLYFYFETSLFTGNLYLGFTGAGFLLAGLLFFVVALILDSLRTQKQLMLKLLFRERLSSQLRESGSSGARS